MAVRRQQMRRSRGRGRSAKWLMLLVLVLSLPLLPRAVFLSARWHTGMDVDMHAQVYIRDDNKSLLPPIKRDDVWFFVRTR